MFYAQLVLEGFAYANNTLSVQRFPFFMHERDVVLGLKGRCTTVGGVGHVVHDDRDIVYSEALECEQVEAT